MLANTNTAFLKCWKENPALLIAIHLLLGAAAALHWHWIYCVVLGILWAPLVLTFKWRLLIYFSLTLTSFYYALFLYPTASLPAKKLAGTAHFKISALSHYASPFSHLNLYKGTIKTFETEHHGCFKNLPCRIYLPLSDTAYPADTDYLIQGTLIEKGPRNFHFKPAKKIPWSPLPNTFSLAQWRHSLKEKVKTHLKKQIPNPKSCAFLTALFTGELDERGLSLEFSHLGLQHILAISGFHFAILAAFFGFFLRLVFPYKITAALLLFAVTLYFVFVGSSPSVQRGWIALLVILVGQLCNLRSSGLNALGVGMAVAIFIDPLLITHLGFQLSFLATSAIFLCYPTINHLLNALMPKRSLSCVVAMNRLNQYGYIFSAFIRETLALSLAVHLFVLPVLLFTFHKFPYLSLLYNLFFPLWTSLAFLLFLTAFLLGIIIPPLGALLHSANSAFTGALLELSAHPPPLLDFSLYCQEISFSLLICILSATLCLAIHTRLTKT
jgi:competence protein ComEC